MLDGAESHPGGVQRVTVDHPCVYCGYNLRSLTWEANCPECNTAVRQSVLPRGFTFASFAEARRFRKGLFLFVASILVAVFVTIAYVVVHRYALQIPLTGRFRTIACLWLYGRYTAGALEAVAICVMVWPRRCGGHLHNTTLGTATLVTASIALFAQLGCLVPLSLSSLSVAPGTIGAVLAWTAPIVWDACSAASLVLVWLCLLRRVDRANAPLLWGFTRVSLLAPVLAFPDGILHATYTIGATISGGSWAGMPWWASMGYTGGMWWAKYVDAPCRVWMLLVVWMFVRRLDAALLRGPGDERRQT